MTQKSGTGIHFLQNVFVLLIKLRKVILFFFKLTLLNSFERCSGFFCLLLIINWKFRGKHPVFKKEDSSNFLMGSCTFIYGVPQRETDVGKLQFKLSGKLPCVESSPVKFRSSTVFDNYWILEPCNVIKVQDLRMIPGLKQSSTHAFLPSVPQLYRYYYY